MMEEFIRAYTILNDMDFLRQKSVDVDILNDKELKEDILKLEKFCLSHEVMAMAAVQIGIPKRLIYLKNTNIDLVNKINIGSATDEEKDFNEARILINPVIIKREGLTEFWEACASCLENTGRVLRPYKIIVEYFDVDNKKHIDEFIGFESTVLSHEYDHLNGILHMDISEENLVMTKDERKEFRKSHGYDVLFEEGDYEKLKEDIHKSETVKAGCYVINKERREVALVHREKQDDYSFPKGHVEDNETIVEGAVREVEEEIKRCVSLVSDVYINRYITPKGERCCCYMYIGLDCGVSNNTSSDTHEVVWVKVEDVLDKLSYPSLKEDWSKVYDEVIKILEKKED